MENLLKTDLTMFKSSLDTAFAVDRSVAVEIWLMKDTFMYFLY